MYRTYEERIEINKRRRNINRKKRAVKAKRARLMLFSVIAIMFLMTVSLLINPATAETDRTKENYPVYTVHANDTLWDIAKSYTDNSKDIRETIYEIAEANNINENDNLIVGEQLVIPVN